MSELVNSEPRTSAKISSIDYCQPISVENTNLLRAGTSTFYDDELDMNHVILEHRDIGHRTSSSDPSSSVMTRMKKMWKSSGGKSSKDSGLPNGNEEPVEKSFDPDKVFTKLSTAWSNVKYGWSFRPRSNFDPDFPVWLLGEFYHCKNDSISYDDSDSLPGLFDQDFSSRIWFTYRRGFPPILDSELESDSGWGCMLRSTQMMLAQAAILHWLGRGWTRFRPPSEASRRTIRGIISLFGDSPNRPLSIHNLCRIGLKRDGKKPGDWHGPASTSHVMKEAIGAAQTSGNAYLSALNVYVSTDCAVCLNEIDELMQWTSTVPKHNNNTTNNNNSTQCWHMCNDVPVNGRQSLTFGDGRDKALVLIVPMRLGTDKLNPIYKDHLRTLLSVKACLGLIGGKPKHSMYFVGAHKESLIYLDPHLCQEYVSVNDVKFSTETYFCDVPRKINICDVDPSCAVGFYCETRNAMLRLFDDLTEVIEQEGVSNRLVSGSNRFPLFSVVNNKKQHVRPPTSDRYNNHRDRIIDEHHAKQHGFELL